MQIVRALLVEDDPEWQRQLAEILLELGYTVQTVSNYADARNRYVSATFDLIIADLRLGSELANRDGVFILEDAFTKGIPAVVVTGYGTRDMVRKADRYDVLKLVHKGAFDKEQFKQTVSEVVRISTSNAVPPTLQQTKEVRQLLRKLDAGEIIE